MGLPAPDPTSEPAVASALKPAVGRMFILLTLHPVSVADLVLQDTFCLTFSVEMDYFGDVRTIPLKQGGEDIPVTEENRHEYVELMVDYLLNR